MSSGPSLIPPPFFWRGLMFQWVTPLLGSQRAAGEYEGYVEGGGLWFTVAQREGAWVATCFSSLGALNYQRHSVVSREAALDVALQDAREVVMQTASLLQGIP